jgi:hypothetical protein
MLTPAQVPRVASHGRRRATERGEILFEAGDSVFRGRIRSGRTRAVGEGSIAISYVHRALAE